MALKEIIRTTQSVFNQIVAGTHATETYDDDNEYQVALDDPIEVGASGSGTKINEDNQLVVDLDADDIPSLPASKITSGTLADERIASASTWNGKQDALAAGDNVSISNNTISATDTTYTDGTNVQITNNAISSLPTTYSNIAVITTPTALSTYNDWDTQQKYGYSFSVTVTGVTANTEVTTIIMTDTIMDAVAYVYDTSADTVTFYTKDATAVSGTIYTMVTRERASS